MPIPTKGVSPVSIPCGVNMVRPNDARRFALVCLATLGWLGITASGWGQEAGTAGRLVNPPGTTAAENQQPVPPAAPTSGPPQSPPLDWLAGTPDMFGDFFRVGSQLQFSSPSPVFPGGVLALPLAGGSPRLAIDENNGTLPQDRVYFLYNHFQNALADNLSGPRQAPCNKPFALTATCSVARKPSSIAPGLWNCGCRCSATAISRPRTRRSRVEMSATWPSWSNT